ncbi:hypothetical protein M440DRAFT_1405234 [Trichoderma longibrachiatum ATCC 18648]|uniref:Secreted protein n=1 Tax=Trichoderma longibrachiatum ATCC 18648 TaxID=983965 RepID=A0A2T4BTZ5_TRILO|nr:hypothetical protein M440DRAFT_1405234 [Trichoderma longibrachiatum ATCC 18648]
MALLSMALVILRWPCVSRDADMRVATLTPQLLTPMIVFASIDQACLMLQRPTICVFPATRTFASPVLSYSQGITTDYNYTSRMLTTHRKG